jgi:3-oxoacyl-[acyl-carrier protein] reductase
VLRIRAHQHSRQERNLAWECPGELDILVNNAGVYDFSPIESVTPEHFRKLYDINVLGLLSTTSEATKYFGKDGGSVINISSLASTGGFPTTSAYSGTKGAVDSITKVLASELGPRKIRVNSINPGMVITEGVKTAGFEGSDFQKDIESRTPLGRIGQPEDIAPAAVFFASSDSSWITGETLVIAGGLR